MSAILGLILLGCAPSVQSITPEKSELNRETAGGVEEVSQVQAPRRNSEPESSSSRQIAEGLYWIGTTGLGLEVSRDRFRYYDEEGYKEWRDVRGLTSIKEGVIFDGENYWCWSQLVPQGRVGSCTAQGWKIATVKAEEEAKEIGIEELSLGGIRLGDNEATIRRKLGAPDRISEDPYDGPRFEYSGLEFNMGKVGAFNIKSTSDRYCTPAGVCPGMALSEVRQIYGASEIFDRGEEGRFIEYYGPRGETCWLKIALGAADRVESVAVACQP
ncbi:hypothetical protein H6G50_03545 [Oscillatoria sp. FACHB-1406]|nr:hypothetical protein [Oscillatoria sp. FACHB-1406]